MKRNHRHRNPMKSGLVTHVTLPRIIASHPLFSIAVYIRRPVTSVTGGPLYGARRLQIRRKNGTYSHEAATGATCSPNLAIVSN